jgi:hypothetical protein
VKAALVAGSTFASFVAAGFGLGLLAMHATRSAFAPVIGLLAGCACGAVAAGTALLKAGK